jgi:uncharacterized protein (DUF983 family)
MRATVFLLFFAWIAFGVFIGVAIDRGPPGWMATMWVLMWLAAGLAVLRIVADAISDRWRSRL